MTLPSVHAIHPAPGGSHGNKTEIYFHGGFVPVSPGHNSPEKGWAFSLEKNLLTTRPKPLKIVGDGPARCEQWMQKRPSATATKLLAGFHAVVRGPFFLEGNKHLGPSSVVPALRRYYPARPPM